MPSGITVPENAFNWTAEKERAAILLAEGTLTQKAIAAQLGVHPDTIRLWKGNVEFRERVRSIIDATVAQDLEAGVRSKAGRIAAMQERWQLLRQVVEERSADAEYQNVAGGQTGLLVHRQRMIGAGKAAQLIDEYELDTGLLGEMRSLEKQIAQELGQWVEKQETDHTVTRVEIVYEDKLPEEL